jgi:hypothetical protein
VWQEGWQRRGCGRKAGISVACSGGGFIAATGSRGGQLVGREGGGAALLPLSGASTTGTLGLLLPSLTTPHLMAVLGVGEAADTGTVTHTLTSPLHTHHHYTHRHYTHHHYTHIASIQVLIVVTLMYRYMYMYIQYMNIHML